MSKLLVEVLSEEIPSRFQNGVLVQLESLFAKECQKHSVIVSGLTVNVSPRRIVIEVEEVKQGVVEPKKGPKVGAPQKAIDGFARSCGVLVADLDLRKIADVEYYFSPSDSTSVDVKESLCKTIERSLVQISWPKSMFWNENKVRWVRPIRNIMAILDGVVLPFEFLGFKANNKSYGHKLMAPEGFEVESADQYHQQLKSRYVIISSEQRKEIIRDQISVIEKLLGVEAIKDENLLNDIVGLVEYPIVKYGEIDKQFLSLPKEVVVKIMSSHQKFIALQNNDVTLAPYFIAVLNVDFRDSEKSIIAGNEKVLSARLYDGKFFFEEDTHVSLEFRVKDLKQVVFHDTLGSLFEKVERIKKISLFLSNFTDVDSEVLARAALLSKADLTTLMVNEFPELQGVIGKYYAQYAGESKEVAQAIDEHYFPVGKDSVCPSSSYGALISVADKIDTVVGLFVAKEIPTSSKDPYALRRCALGVIRIVCGFSLNINLIDLIKYSAGCYEQNFDDNILNQILEFVYERFRYWLKEDFRDDFISASLYSRSGCLLQEYYVLKLLERLFRSNKDLFFTFKRVTNIIETNKIDNVEIKKEFLNVDEEKLLKKIESLEGAIKDFYGCNNDGNLVKIFADIEEIVGNLFTNTMIIDKNIEIRKHRISVLKMLYYQFKKIADFSLIDL